MIAISSSAILIRWASAPALALSFWRCLGGAALLAPVTRRESARQRTLARTDRIRLGASGVLLAAHFGLFTGSLSYTTVASSVTLATISPIFVAAGSMIVLGERTTHQVWAGLTTTMIGAIAIGAGDFADTSLGSDALLGDAMAVGAAATMAAYMVIGRSLRLAGMPNSIYSGWSYAIAAVTLLVTSLVTGTALAGFDTQTWLAIFGLIVGPQLLGHTVLNHLLSTMSATLVSLFVLLEPVGATILAALIFAERPATLFWVGAPLVLIGVATALADRGADSPAASRGPGRPARERRSHRRDRG